MATLDQVLSQMQAADMPPLPQGHPIADGKIHRFGREKKCWYILFDYPARNGKRYIAGAFGRWAGTDNGKIIVKSDYAGMEPDELQRLQRSQAPCRRASRRSVRSGRALPATAPDSSGTRRAPSSRRESRRRPTWYASASTGRKASACTRTARCSCR
jgi:hypothetical protein